MERTLVRKIRSVLTPDLLKPQYRKHWSPGNPTFGHCYVASEALYHLLGGDRSEWMPARGRDKNGVHWWLEHRETGKILDPTADQYQKAKPPYQNGRRAGFLTKQPSKRAQEVMRRIG